MTARLERTPTQLMHLYWDACRSRQEQPRKVYGLVALPGTNQPAGVVICWGVSRKFVESQQEKRSDADKWEIREFQPT